MTEIVNPSYDVPISSYNLAGAIAHSGGTEDGYIRPGTDPSEMARVDGQLDHSTFTAFDQSSSSSSHDVTIHPGEAFVYGSWLAIDTDTTINLDGSTAGQTISVGWDRSQGNVVQIDKDGNFGEADRRIPIWEFDTDGSGVTSSTDLRPIGKSFGADAISATSLSVTSILAGDTDSVTITETGSPRSFTFDAGEGRDIHIDTVLTITNGTTTGDSEDVTVELYDGTDNTGELIVSETQTVTLNASETDTYTYHTSPYKLDDGTYYVEVTSSGSVLTVDETAVSVRNATYGIEQTASGDLDIVSDQGNSMVEFDTLGNYTRFKTGVEYAPVGEPAAPESGWVLFTDSSDGSLKVKDSAGAITTLAS